MSNIVPFKDPQDYKRIEQRIRKLWDLGEVEVLPHAFKRLGQRRVDMLDVQNVILRGRVVDHSMASFRWRHVMEGKTVDGCNLRVVVEVEGNLLIVSVISLKQRR